MLSNFMQDKKKKKKKKKRAFILQCSQMVSLNIQI